MSEEKKLFGMEVGTSIGLIVLLAAVVLIAVLVFYQFPGSSNSGGGSDTPNGDTPPSSVTAEFAECITESGAVFYGTNWCSHCNDQKEIFGQHMDKITFVDCDAGDLCARNGVTAFPTWIINGEKYLGTKSPEVLAALTGCEI